MLPDLIRRGRTPSVGITVHAATITLRITAEGATSQECQAAMEPTAATIRECLGSLVFGEEDDELEDAVTRLLTESKRTLVTVEKGTGGALATCLSRTAGGGDRYLGGQVIGSLAMLTRWLGENGELVSRHGPTSREVAEAMAETARRAGGTTLRWRSGRFRPTAHSKPTHRFISASPRRTK